MIPRQLVVWGICVASVGLGSVSRADELTQDAVVITLDEVVGKVSRENYLVLENAQRIYQAKQSIQVARGNLLPKLNIFKMAEALLTAPIDPRSVLGIVEDIAPFLIPSNWFRVKEAKLFYSAQREAYRALWANEVMTAKALYFHALIDQSLLDHVKNNIKELRSLYQTIRDRELVGTIPEGPSRDIEVRILALQEDQRALEVVLTDEMSLLGYLIGLKTGTELVLAPVQLPNFEALKPLQYADFEPRASDLSPEIAEYGYIIQAADYVKKEATFSFMGISSMSRGVSGGAFDSLPLQSGLGFGTGASIRVAKSQKKILQIQKAGVEETVKRHLQLLVNNYNLDLENYQNLKKRVELTAHTLGQLNDRMKLGIPVSAGELIEASRNHIQADTAFFAVRFRFLANEDRLSRLIFHGDYGSAPVPQL